MSQTNKKHPYLSGNFRPVSVEHPLTPCEYTGVIPHEFHGGQYVRNGSNPLLSAKDPHPTYHWFDGDGMLAGVHFDRDPIQTGKAIPKFVNRWMLTDIHQANRSLPIAKPLLPSISRLLLPRAHVPNFMENVRTFLTTILALIRSIFMCIVLRVAKLSAANTNVIFHDGRAIALCESGSGWEVRLPGLESVGWWCFEGLVEDRGKTTSGLGGRSGWIGKKFHEWVTAHPRTDPQTGDLVLYSSGFYPPYVHHSVIGKDGQAKRISIPIPGVSAPRMMHDFACSLSRSLIMDLPLSLSPWNLLQAESMIKFYQDQPSRFGIFSRMYTGAEGEDGVKWFEDKEACCIFHTANAWDSTTDSDCAGSFNLLACRFRSAKLVSLAGNVTAPLPPPTVTPEEEDICLLTYYRFDMSSSGSENKILDRFPLLSTPFEFPAFPPALGMQSTRWIYGCSLSTGGFDACLGSGAKIDCILKIDVRSLVQKGMTLSKEHGLLRNTPVDKRSVGELLEARNRGEQPGPIRVFKFPEGTHGQEVGFVPKSGWKADGEHEMGKGTEDEGWLVCYVFDEAVGLDETGECKVRARSELWVIDAAQIGLGMVGTSDSTAVVCKIHLPARVPYGLHGDFFTESQIASQRPISSTTSLIQPSAPIPSWAHDPSSGPIFSSEGLTEVVHEKATEDEEVIDINCSWTNSILQRWRDRSRKEVLVSTVRFSMLFVWVWTVWAGALANVIKF
ncbi:Beta, beta-carotene 15,15'-dioxygenase and related enzymes [Phaffia rhodozyma]|uniref:Beta, beta-carotene 15,15'-dioxygenase and related enzymes n=1 Tax=Phaffia rhodozyma TaxID=264483 RepID=A0A0F7SS56_PHARH|nr:Beta, beta-carotene 15,15'-dioxygenase and related enzymes [Phaffia rhodozyma]